MGRPAPVLSGWRWRAASISAVNLVAKLAEIVGPNHCLTDPDLRASYETDFTRRWTGAALAVVRPGSTDEVAAVLRACADAGVGVVPQGGNTGLVGGSVPRDGEVVLSLRRLNAIEDVDADAGEMTVGAGVTLAAAQSAARAAGWEVGVDFGARDTATIGGMVATNAGGVNVLRHGPMRRQIGGFEAVLADGTVLRRLPGMPKDNTGYDLGGLLAGSEGTLAVITAGAAAARAAPGTAGGGRHRPRQRGRCGGRGRTPAPRARIVAWRSSSSPMPAWSWSCATHRSRRRSIDGRSTCSSRPARTRPIRPTTSPRRSTRSERATRRSRPTPAGRHRLWQLRERHTEAMNAEGVPHKLDVSVPLTRYAELVERAPEAVRAVDPDARTIVYGHLGDGNLHVNVLGPRARRRARRTRPSSSWCWSSAAASAPSTASAWRRWTGWSATGARPRYRPCARIKRAWDPAGILNPGVIFRP